MATPVRPVAGPVWAAPSAVRLGRKSLPQNRLDPGALPAPLRAQALPGPRHRLWGPHGGHGGSLSPESTISASRPLASHGRGVAHTGRSFSCVAAHVRAPPPLPGCPLHNPSGTSGPPAD